MRLNPKETALLVIDVQVDFCSPEGLSAKRGRGIRHITEMLPKLRAFLKVAKDKGVPTFFTQMICKEHPPANYAFLRDEKGMADVCLDGTPGAELYMVAPSAGDTVIRKERYDAFADTDLKRILSERGIRNVLVSGVRSDICVDATAKRAFAEGYNVFILADLVATSDGRQPQQEALLEAFGKYSGFVATATEIGEMLA